MMLVTQPALPALLQKIAAEAEVLGEAAMATGFDADAAHWFRIEERADDLFLALTEEDADDHHQTRRRGKGFVQPNV